jgi:uncharacterized protein YcgL (UPF0745 family)
VATASCWIYKSLRKNQMYLYLTDEGDFTRVPAPLLERFGRPGFVMKLALHAHRRLAHADVNEVLSQLRQRGWYLQMPPADASGFGSC